MTVSSAVAACSKAVRAWAGAIRRPRKPAVAASVISAAIASGVVGIGNHSIINRADEGGMALHAKPDPPLVDRARVGLERGGQQGVRSVARKGEKQMPDVLRRNAVLEQRIINRVDQRQIVKFE